ncbi:DNA primase [Atopomonas sediminilitoris]|uniref:DNA primase n=1 Tax=Atopomonas sediminilitoris TaxID=2919919 RepID=UPI001F4DB5CF|nr:DNA primase [Atopomonas sediminilitoris]MCJ8168510.1 DNA primase [Atopomonas sediminilitoris]
MAGLIPQRFVDDLLDRIDIVEVVGSRIQLKKAGKNYSARCPFHNEKTPSFSVSPDKQFYYCFGCGAGGNALSFLMEHDHLPFPEAVEDLARRAGLEVVREDTRPGQPQQRREPKDSPLYPLLEAANQFYKQALRNHPARSKAVEYLKKRGLSGEIARDFGVGFAPPGWDNLGQHLGGDSLQQKALIDAGLVVENPDSGRRYDRFRDRIIFPIRDSRGRVIAFGGRVLGDDKPKYLNSPETPVFHKGQELYGLFEARQHNRQLNELIVVEGYMDVIALAQQGIRNGVATLGTATSEEHLKRMFRLVPQILFCFDGDKAGRAAAWRALESALPTLEDGRKVRFLFLPEGEDPDTLIRAEGLDAFQARIVQHAMPLADYFFQQLSHEADPKSLEGKAHFATLAAPLLAKVPGEKLRSLMLKRVSELTGLDSASLAIAAPAASEHDYPGDYFNNQEDSGPPPYADASAHIANTDKPRKPWNSDKFGKKNWRKDPPPRVAVAVEPPLLGALRCLLLHPELAQEAGDTQALTSGEDSYSQLLAALLESLRKHPEQTTVHLLARWHGTEQGKLLSALAQREWLINGDNQRQQFLDSLQHLLQQQRDKRIAQLLQQSRENGLSDAHKDELRLLLSRKSQPPPEA